MIVGLNVLIKYIEFSKDNIEHFMVRNTGSLEVASDTITYTYRYTQN